MGPELCGVVANLLLIAAKLAVGLLHPPALPSPGKRHDPLFQQIMSPGSVDGERRDGRRPGRRRYKATGHVLNHRVVAGQDHHRRQECQRSERQGEEAVHVEQAHQKDRSRTVARTAQALRSASSVATCSLKASTT